MPKISNLERDRIRNTARKYTMGLWVSPFNEGLLIYSETFEALYIRSARWKFCLKCGEIEQTEQMLDESELKYIDSKDKTTKKERVHRCTMGVNHFPVLITTSWYKLKDFFLSNKYITALESAGIKDTPQQQPIIKEIFAEAKKLGTEQLIVQQEST